MTFSKDHIKVAIASSERDPNLFHWTETPGWITSGHFAVLVEAGQESEYGSKIRLGAGHDTLPIMAKEAEERLANKDESFLPMRELEGTYEPWKDGSPEERSPDVECGRCRGSGNCICSCGDDHDCGECDGDGKIKGKITKPDEPRIDGKVKFKTDKRWNSFQGRFRDLMLTDGVRLYCGDYLEPAFGFDADGKCVLIVMPMRDE